MRPELKEILEYCLVKLPFVLWDRFYEDQEDVEVYGWIKRDDAHEDFVSLRFEFAGMDENEEPSWNLEYSTSSAAYSKEIFQILGCTGRHNDCQRVESVLTIPNMVRLSNPRAKQAQT